MSLKCSLGLHTWDHCVCTSCGKKRDEQHVLNEDCEKCSKCGATFENQHDWTKNCKKCSKCGKTRDVEHVWTKDCEKCAKCNETRVNQHQLVNGICQICGHGTFTDPSDSKVYKIIKIGNQVIMAENYAKEPRGARYWAYDEDEKNVVRNGYLYDWETAKTIAPEGWHLPTKEEWETLNKGLGENSKEVYEHLKIGGNSCFEATLGGWRLTSGTFNSLGASGHFWSCTEEGEKEVWQCKVSAYSGTVEIEKGNKNLGLSIRYFKD